MSFDLANALKTIAPTLATMLGGPLAGTAVSAIEESLGLKTGSGVDQISQLVQSGSLTPEQITALKVADLKHQEIMGQQNIDLTQINLDYQKAIIKADVDDKASARQASVDGGTAKGLFWLSIIILIVCFGAEITVLFHGYPKDVVPDIVVGRILGLLDAAATTTIAFWFGSSHGSKQKDAVLVAKQ